MRVIAGRYGGRRLKAPKGRTTRPTSDRVKEALFAMLGEIEDARVLDLFAGTGALGIEALSRGARRAVFVERDADALKALGANLEDLGLVAEVAEVRREDALDALKAARKRKETYDLVLIDPPYGRAHQSTVGDPGGTAAERWGRELSSAIVPALLRPRARMVVESDRRMPLELELALEKERRYGDTTIRIYRHE
jgi:16S rRNA (guanine966-N2)-methyltransferase